MSAFIHTLKTHAPDPDHPVVTIAIPVRNPNEPVFAECLRSIMAQPLFPYCEIVVIDSSTRPVETFKAFKNTLRVFPLSRKNVSGARQDSLDHARGEVIVGIDCDCIADPGWLAGILTPLDREKGFMTVMGHNLPGVEGWISDWFQDAYEGWLFYVSAAIDQTRYMFTLDTKNYAVFTDTAREIGFDDDLKAGEDHDFATRMRRAGYHIVYAPGAEVRHVHRQTLRQLLKQQGWHGFGYGQTVVKNDFDIYCRRPFRHIVKQGLFFLLFPVFFLKLLTEFFRGGWKRTRAYLVNWLITYRFQIGMIRGMASRGGWPLLKKRFLSDIFSSYPDAGAEKL